MASIYELNGRVPVLQAVPFGLQHVLAMFVANITPIIILANVAGVNAELSAALIQNCMVVAGIGTLVQLYPVWRIGSRLPIVMGISFTFLSLAIAIATTQGMARWWEPSSLAAWWKAALDCFPNTGPGSSPKLWQLRL